MADSLSGRFWPGPLFTASPPGRILFLTTSGQTRFLLLFLRRCGFSSFNFYSSHHFLIFAKKTFLLALLGRARFVGRSFSSHDVDSQNLRHPTTQGGRFCKNENLCNFLKQEAHFLDKPFSLFCGFGRRLFLA